jgi:transposase
MSRGRRIGQTEVSIDDVNTIITLTLSSTYSRRQIAEKVNRSTNTVYRYQKEHGVI